MKKFTETVTKQLDSIALWQLNSIVVAGVVLLTIWGCYTILRIFAPDILISTFGSDELARLWYLKSMLSVTNALAIFVYILIIGREIKSPIKYMIKPTKYEEGKIARAFVARLLQAGKEYRQEKRIHSESRTLQSTVAIISVSGALYYELYFLSPSELLPIFKSDTTAGIVIMAILAAMTGKLLLSVYLQNRKNILKEI